MGMADPATEESVALHPMAQHCLRAVEAKEPGDKSAIPAQTLRDLEAKLKREIDDRTLFEHLCVLSFRLEDGGLKVASQQLLALARIGLDAIGVEETLKREAMAKQDAEALAKSEDKMKAGSKLAGGLAPKSKPVLSVGLGKKPTKKS